MSFTSKMKKALSVLLTAALLLSMSGMVNMPVKAADPAAPVSPAEGITSSDIVVLYDNDVHCSVDGYAVAGAMKKEMQAKTQNVAMVSCGDFVQGGTLGTLTKGESIIKIMNTVGYDVVTLGNHEFDYTIPQLKKLTKELTAKVVSSNFRYAKTNKPVYNGYVMKKYGNKKVAFVGITTPESFTKSTPVYFQNSKGKYIYTFCNDKTGKKLYQQVQKTVNAAKKKGADYVVAVSHLGMEGTTACWTSEAVLKNTYGIDVMLDGHSHETYAANTVKNSKGKDVICSQTGTKFANIGKLVIAKDGTISTSLVSTKEYTNKDEAVAAEIKVQNDAFAGILNQVIGKTEQLLTIMKPDSDKDRAIRMAETNLGDFCSDAYRQVMGADIALINGGGIRTNVKAGDITYKNVIDVFPFGNMACVISLSGQQIKDALEMGASKYPGENGGFLQVSGLKYTIDSSVPSSVKVDEKGVFQKVEGAYRVSDVRVLNQKTGKYEELNLTKYYQVAGVNYTLRNCGDGMGMFKGAKVIKDDTMVDAEVLISYIKNNLKGVVGSDYANQQGEGRITIK